jgi:leukotriene A-4 hydrolase/aminopeptidase
MNLFMPLLRYFFLFIILTSFIMCQNQTVFEQYSKEDRVDHHSFSQPSKAITTHLSLDLNVDFNSKTLIGSASFDIISNNADEIILDVRDLKVEKVILNGTQETEFRITKARQFLGQALHINIENNTETVRVFYSTSPNAAAVQWLNPKQTAGKVHPFLFTQGQAILTRTWIPCQDSPGIRITYDAKISVPKDLMAVMSAANPLGKNDSGVYEFEMKQAIPPYLIALAVGDLTFGEIGPRTGIYAEPSMLEASVWEFADMENMLIAAEELYGDYLWERFDVIVLPPSFPFGGMENPRLTFATPTILAGDRSLTSLIAHELAHSWSGNLVTNATWNDFWLNEGFTVYFERRIMEALYGSDYSNMLSMLGLQDLQDDVEDIGKESADTHLFLNLNGRDPDDGMSAIAYEKGAYFLLSLEAQVGREIFDEFLKNYFDSHQFGTITTAEFLHYLDKNLLKPHNINHNIDEWVNGPGIPSNCPHYDSNRFDLVEDQMVQMLASKDISLLQTEKWSSHEWLHFVRQLPTDLDEKSMSSLDIALNLSNSGNSEILAAWFELSIKNGYWGHNINQIEKFLVNVGRRKFLTPLYRAFKENGHLEEAIRIYKKAKENYHSIASSTMDELLNQSI